MYIKTQICLPLLWQTLNGKHPPHPTKKKPTDICFFCCNTDNGVTRGVLKFISHHQISVCSSSIEHLCSFSSLFRSPHLPFLYCTPHLPVLSVYPLSLLSYLSNWSYISCNLSTLSLWLWCSSSTPLAYISNIQIINVSSSPTKGIPCHLLSQHGPTSSESRSVEASSIIEGGWSGSWSWWWWCQADLVTIISPYTFTPNGIMVLHPQECLVTIRCVHKTLVLGKHPLPIRTVCETLPFFSFFPLFSRGIVIGSSLTGVLMKSLVLNRSVAIVHSGLRRPFNPTSTPNPSGDDKKGNPGVHLPPLWGTGGVRCTQPYLWWWCITQISILETTWWVSWNSWFLPLPIRTMFLKPTYVYLSIGFRGHNNRDQLDRCCGERFGAS